MQIGPLMTHLNFYWTLTWTARMTISICTWEPGAGDEDPFHGLAEPQSLRANERYRAQNLLSAGWFYVLRAQCWLPFVLYPSRLTLYWYSPLSCLNSPLPPHILHPPTPLPLSLSRTDIFRGIISLAEGWWWGWSGMKASINWSLAHGGHYRPLKAQVLVRCPKWAVAWRSLPSSSSSSETQALSFTGLGTF